MKSFRSRWDEIRSDKTITTTVLSLLYIITINYTYTTTNTFITFILPIVTNLTTKSAIFKYSTSERIYALQEISNLKFARGDNDGYLKVWSSLNFTILRQFQSNGYIISAIIVLDNGDITTGGYDEVTNIWFKSNFSIRTTYVQYRLYRMFSKLKKRILGKWCPRLYNYCLVFGWLQSLRLRFSRFWIKVIKLKH